MNDIMSQISDTDLNDYEDDSDLDPDWRMTQNVTQTGTVCYFINIFNYRKILSNWSRKLMLWLSKIPVIRRIFFRIYKYHEFQVFLKQHFSINGYCINMMDATNMKPTNFDSSFNTSKSFLNFRWWNQFWVRGGNQCHQWNWSNGKRESEVHRREEE